MQRRIFMFFLLSFLPVGIFHAAVQVWQLPLMTLPEVSVVYDVNGIPLQTLSQANAPTVQTEDIAEVFLDAIVAIEDRRFYRHHGIDPAGMVRALWKDVRSGGIVEGGSTITQQTAKLLFLSHEQTFRRKLLDIVYALQLERQYTKQEILTLYCNAAYFGHGAYGIEAAAHTYFARTASELTLPQAALLAGLLQSPSNYDPYIHPEKARERQWEVLAAMQKEGRISAQQARDAFQEELTYQASSLSGEAPWLLDSIREQLIAKYGQERVYQGGLKIYTTVDREMQRIANQAVQEQLQAYDTDLQAAVIALEPGTGYVRAMVGGRDYTASAYNRVYARRQPGSTYKPFVYSYALEQGYTQAELIECCPRSYTMENGEVYTPTDYGNTPYHHRYLTLREAVMRSDNVIAVYIHSLLNPQNTAQYIRAFGFEQTRPVLSSVLGSVECSPLELAAGYNVFAGNGVYAEPLLILKIVDSEGSVLEENTPQAYPILDKRIAYVMTDLLQSVMLSPGTGAHLQEQVGRAVAAKTGTTDDFHDAWMAGYTPELCCVVWVGYDDERDVNQTGGGIAGPIWGQFFHEALQGYPPRAFACPEGITFTTICMETGEIAAEGCPWSMTAAFIAGTEPQDFCWKHTYRQNIAEEWTAPTEETENAAETEPDIWQEINREWLPEWQEWWEKQEKSR